MKQPNVLREILLFKEKDIAARKKKVPIGELKKNLNRFELRNFRDAISSKKKPINLIAEIKQASPSNGLLRQKFDLQQITAIYSKHAQAISVLTDERFFQGRLEYLQEVRGQSSLPVLQKDFVLDEYQLYEARAHGADAVLLIAAALAKDRLRKLHSAAKNLGLQCLVEVHSSACIEKALAARAEIIGINNRNLESLKVSLNTTIGLRSMVPEGRAIVSESGFNSAADVEMVKGKVDAVLIGSALMRADDIEAKLFELGF